MKLDNNLFMKISALGKLEIPKEKQLGMIKDFNAIIAWIAQLNQLDTATTQPLETMSLQKNVFNQPQETVGFYKSKNLHKAFCKNTDYFSVPIVKD